MRHESDEIQVRFCVDLQTNAATWSWYSQSWLLLAALHTRLQSGFTQLRRPLIEIQISLGAAHYCWLQLSALTAVAHHLTCLEAESAMRMPLAYRGWLEQGFHHILP
jgi:hypothetical protein